MNTSVAEKKAAPEDEATLVEARGKAVEAIEAMRKEPAVQPGCLWRQKAGSRYCQWECRWPEGASVEDLTEPGLWWRCQQEPQSALRRDDEVRILAFDSSWVAHCHVAHAGSTQVVLAVVSITELPERREQLFEDDRYAVRFVGNGYAVYRKHDGQQMAQPVHSAAAAQTNLVNLYPKRV